ncbi:MAG: peroxidase-related enzyme [Bacteroidales bacterium]|nr:peroxidase-related enzyme [Bacteroidales bacterium]
MARISVIEYEEANGRLLEIYNELIEKRGKLAEIHKIQSLRPESIIRHIDLYLEIMFSKSELSRAEREMMAVVVSAANQCKYCISHHAEALNHYWKDPEKTNTLIEDHSKAGINSRQNALCSFARQLTLQPADFEEDNETNRLRSAGLTDSAILDATLVVAYFNFVNRIVLALRVEPDKNEIKGYKY